MSGASERVSGASERANGRASGPVLQSVCLVILAQNTLAFRFVAGQTGVAHFGVTIVRSLIEKAFVTRRALEGKFLRVRVSHVHFHVVDAGKDETTTVGTRNILFGLKMSFPAG